MNIYLTICNKYLPLLKIQEYALNTFFDASTPVVILGFDPPDFKLSNRFDFVSLGKEEEFPNRIWTDPLIPFFESIDDEYFILLLDDLIIYEKADLPYFAMMEKIMQLKQADKIILDRHLINNSIKHDEFTNELLQTADYRSTLQASIWSKKYFMKLLKPGLTIWEFEMNNFGTTKNDGATILMPNQKDIFNTLNIYLRGRFCNDCITRSNHHKYNLITEDLIYIIESTLDEKFLRKE